MRRAAKIDRNQPEIVKVLRQVGASVQQIHAIGKGCPDILVGFRGVNYVFEIKDGALIPSAKKLTPDETEWFQSWRGNAQVVETVADVLRVLGIN